MIYTYIHIHVYIYTYKCISMCVCMYIVTQGLVCRDAVVAETAQTMAAKSRGWKS